MSRIGDRKAALALHALAPADRRWILDRLSSPERARIEPLAAELGTLDARFEPDDIAALTDVSKDGAVIQDPDFAHVDATALSATLAAEPDWLVSALLHGATASSRPVITAALAPGRALGRTSTVLPETVERALRTALLQRSQHVPGASMADRLLPAFVTDGEGGATTARAPLLERMRRWLP